MNATKQDSQYWWCLHCQTAHHEQDTIYHDNGESECPRCGAGSHELLEWRWLRERHPGYPAIPKTNKEYPLY